MTPTHHNRAHRVFVIETSTNGERQWWTTTGLPGDSIQHANQEDAYRARNAHNIAHGHTATN